MRKGQKYRIRNRNYRNFMIVMRWLAVKGYDHDECEEMARRIFDEYEANPNGLSVEQRVDMILPKAEWEAQK